MLDLPIADGGGKRLHIASLTLDQLAKPAIAIGDHCYACTAGIGQQLRRHADLTPCFHPHQLCDL